MSQTHHLKIFTVQIDVFRTNVTPTNLWYKNKGNEVFNCVLVAKFLNSGYHIRYLVVDKKGSKFEIPLHLRTIKPEDCHVIHEQVVRVSPMFYLFVHGFSSDRIASRKDKTLFETA